MNRNTRFFRKHIQTPKGITKRPSRSIRPAPPDTVFVELCKEIGLFPSNRQWRKFCMKKGIVHKIWSNPRPLYSVAQRQKWIKESKALCAGFRS